MFRFNYSGAIIASALTVFFAAAAQNVPAQALSNYYFTPSNGTFTELSGATIQPLENGDKDDGWYPLAPVGFNFTYNGTVYTQVSASTNGFMRFGDFASADFFNSLTDRGARPLAAPLWDDLAVEFFTGTVSYKTIGTAPNRVFTMQWLNMVWSYQAVTPVISFQVKLYETTNQVQFIYRQEAGALNNLPPAFGASIGLTATATGSGNFLSLSDSGTNPTVSSTVENTRIITKPATGQIYTFSPNAPTATSVFIAGRVKTPNGRGLTHAFVTLTDSSGKSRLIPTSTFGYFRFENVAANETYIIQVITKRYRFTPQTFIASRDLTNFDLTVQNSFGDPQ